MKSDITFLFKYLKRQYKTACFSFILLILVSLTSLIPPYLTKLIMDQGIEDKNYSKLLVYCFVCLIIYLINNVFDYSSNYFFSYLNEKILLDIKNDLIKKILYIPLSFFTANEKGYILSRISEVNSLSGLFSISTFKLILSFFEFIGCSLIIFRINVKLSIIAYLFMPIYYIIISSFFKKIKKISFESMEKNAASVGKLQETINGIRTIKMLNQENKISNKVKKINEDLTQLSIKQNSLLNSLTSITALSGNIISITILFFAGTTIIKNQMTLGDYFAFVGYLPKILTPIQLLSSKSVTIQPGIIALKRIREIFNKYSSDDEDDSKNKITEIKGSIVIDNLKFRYENTDKYIFDGLSIEIQEQDKVLIKGENGSGKSTLIQLISGLYNNYQGNIFIDNVDIKTVNKKSIRKRIGIVSQDVFLFNSNIKDNILYDSEISDENLERFQELNEILTEFPLGLLTPVGENGELLSGGQKQLIAVARSLINMPDILILDEATTNLDVKKKNIIKNIIDKYFNNKTCLFISHDNVVDFSINKIIDLDNLSI